MFINYHNANVGKILITYKFFVLKYNNKRIKD